MPTKITDTNAASKATPLVTYLPHEVGAERRRAGKHSAPRIARRVGRRTRSPPKDATEAALKHRLGTLRAKHVEGRPHGLYLRTHGGYERDQDEHNVHWTYQGTSRT